MAKKLSTPKRSMKKVKSKVVSLSNSKGKSAAKKKVNISAGSQKVALNGSNRKSAAASKSVGAKRATDSKAQARSVQSNGKGAVSATKKAVYGTKPVAKKTVSKTASKVAVTSKAPAKKAVAKGTSGKQAFPKKVAAKSSIAKTGTKSAGKVSTKGKGNEKSATTTKQVVAKKLSGKVPLVKAAPSKKATTPQDYSQFRTMLLEKRRRLFGDVAMMSEEALGSTEAAVDNHAPIHPAEVGSHSFEQEFTLGLLSRDGDKIRMVDMALEKIAEGSYGVCDECGGRIPKGRLEMLPESIYCVKCASKLEEGSGF